MASALALLMKLHKEGDNIILYQTKQGDFFGFYQKDFLSFIKNYDSDSYYENKGDQLVI